jgi:hypothetical protein
MVIFLSLYPLLFVGALFALDIPLPIELVAITASSPVIISVLSVLTLAAVLVAAYRRRENTLLMSAWLFLFCGLVVLSLGSLLDPFLLGADAWVEELFATAAFFPLLFFAVLIASPVRLLILPRRRRALYLTTGVVVLVAVFAVVFLPWLFTYEGPRLHGSVRHLLALARPVLDTVLAEPLALLVLVIGLASGSGPYFLVGIGLLLFIPEDILDHFQLLQQMDPHGLLSNLISIASRLYLLNGALLGVFKRERALTDLETGETLPS